MRSRALNSRRFDRFGHRQGWDLSESGATTVEFALVMIPFLLLIFGTIEFSRLVWTQSSLQYAVERAARCAAIDTVNCGTPAQIQNYAVAHMLAPGVPSSAFSSATVACGISVTASTNFTFILTFVAPAPVPLNAKSCYPK